MAPTPAVNPMSEDQSVALSEFARACRAAARSVSLYPRTHPSIQASLSRVTAAAGRLIPADAVLISVHPDTLTIEGRPPLRPDAAIGELAALMHERLIGEIRIERTARLEDWHALLLLLARQPDELMTDGGIGKAWAATGRDHFEIREIDYAEVLRERTGDNIKEWDAIIRFCLEGGTLGERELAALLDVLKDSSQFGALLERLQSEETGGGASVNVRAAALITLVQKLLEATAQLPKAQGEDVVLQMAADGVARLTPEMVLALVRHTQAPDREQAQIASAVIDRVKDETVATFVANSIVKERGASERLAQALEALVLDDDHKDRLLDLAKEEAARHSIRSRCELRGALAVGNRHAGVVFGRAVRLRPTMPGSCPAPASRPLTSNASRMTPPIAFKAWLGDHFRRGRPRQLDFQLLLDLLKVENDPAWWAEIAGIVASEVERRALAGDIQAAQQAAQAIVREATPGGRELLRGAAESAIDKLASGRLARTSSSSSAK